MNSEQDSQPNHKGGKIDWNTFLPVKKYDVGEPVVYMEFPYTVLSQNGHDVEIKSCEDDYQTTVKDYDLY